MFNAIRRRLGEREEGFTLIELLVVVIIIGILSAIAVPTFLSQRQRAGDAAAKADLRNMAIYMEQIYTDTGSYPTANAAGVTALRSAGFRKSDGVTVNFTSGATYCLSARHTSSAPTAFWQLTSSGANAGSPAAAAGHCASGFEYTNG